MTDVLRGLVVVLNFGTLVMILMTLTRWSHEWIETPHGHRDGDQGKVMLAALSVQVVYLIAVVSITYARLEGFTHNLPFSYRDVSGSTMAAAMFVSELLILKSENLWRPEES